jgi:ferrous iron transport protein A
MKTARMQNPELDTASQVTAAGGIRLADLATGAAARVVSIAAAAGGESAGLSRRLRLRIVARGFLGREPIAVRIGTGTFALRLFEAACIRVCPEPVLLR